MRYPTGEDIEAAMLSPDVGPQGTMAPWLLDEIDMWATGPSALMTRRDAIIYFMALGYLCHELGWSVSKEEGDRT